MAPRSDKASGGGSGRRRPDVPDALPGTSAGADMFADPSASAPAVSDTLPARTADVDSATAEEITGVVRAALDAAGRAGSASAAGVGDAVERAARALARRVVTGAATRRHALSDRASLARALSEKPPTPAIAGAAAAAIGLRFLTRYKGLRVLAKRTPMWLLATAVPTLVASVTRGADELGMVSAHLIHRARAEGIEPDLERVRRAAVQIVSHRVVDPDSEPSHGALAVQWLRRAFRAVLPFTSGIATADPEGLAAAASELDPRTLAVTLTPA